MYNKVTKESEYPEYYKGKTLEVFQFGVEYRANTLPFKEGTKQIGDAIFKVFSLWSVLFLANLDFFSGLCQAMFFLPNPLTSSEVFHPFHALDKQLVKQTGISWKCSKNSTV